MANYSNWIPLKQNCVVVSGQSLSCSTGTSLHNASNPSLNASSFGRPMMISDAQFDTKPLASMNDCDLRPGCKMPPPRPANPESLTDTTYATCKLAFAIVVRNIMSSLFGLTLFSYD